MSKPFLEVTYRNGEVFAAYLYLSQAAGKSVRVQRRGNCMVDFDSTGRAIGIEFTSAKNIDIAAINLIMTELQQPMLSKNDLMPLHAA